MTPMLQKPLESNINTISMTIVRLLAVQILFLVLSARAILLKMDAAKNELLSMNPDPFLGM